MAYLKPTPTTETEKLVGKISDGQSVKLAVPAKVKATGTTNDGVTNGILTWTAVEAGLDGNGITIVQEKAGFNTPLSIVVSEKTITIALATGADPGAVTTTAAALKTAIEAKAEAAALVTVAYSGNGTGLCIDCSEVLAGGLDNSVTAKNFYLISHFFGMAMTDAVAEGEVVLDLEEAEYVTDQIKTGDAFIVGAKVYWDPTYNWFTETAGALTLVGIVTVAKDADDNIQFKLINSVI